ncbi:hypothetical protein CEXT_663741 [Caerostris extrusa]|uniref:Ig-like domain-containing protein n=1 Tax=Caerostris extrusa TaxID=172846 RepID=A0AAV4X246_CAEEX|nr:hypothetical protein CEXT_663741 [Caerostris extrusa]
MALRYYFPDLSSSDEEGPSTFTVFTEFHRDPSPVKRRRLNPVTTYSSEDEGSSVVPVGRNLRIQSNHGATPVAGKPITIYCSSTSSLTSGDDGCPDVVPIRWSPPLQISEGTPPVAGRPPAIICSSEDESSPDSVPVWRKVSKRGGRATSGRRTPGGAPGRWGAGGEGFKYTIVFFEDRPLLCPPSKTLRRSQGQAARHQGHLGERGIQGPSPCARQLILLKCIAAPKPTATGNNQRYSSNIASQGVRSLKNSPTYNTWKQFDTRRPLLHPQIWTSVKVLEVNGGLRS